MNSYLFAFKKKALHLIATITFLIWALVTTSIILIDEKEIILIAIDSDGTRIVGTNNDPIFKSEIVSFLKHYTSSLYNFSPITFSEKVGAAVEFMSLDLWAKEESKYKELQNFVKREDISVSGEVYKITKNNDESYTVEMDIVERSKILTKKRKLFTTIKLQKVERDENNIWGIEVVSHDEKYTAI